MGEDTASHRIEEVVKRSHARTDGLLTRAAQLIQEALRPFGRLEDQYEQPALEEEGENENLLLRPRHPL